MTIQDAAWRWSYELQYNFLKDRKDRDVHPELSPALQSFQCVLAFAR